MHATAGEPGVGEGEVFFFRVRGPAARSVVQSPQRPALGTCSPALFSPAGICAGGGLLGVLFYDTSPQFPFKNLAFQNKTRLSQATGVSWALRVEMFLLV